MAIELSPGAAAEIKRYMEAEKIEPGYRAADGHRRRRMLRAAIQPGLRQ